MFGDHVLATKTPVDRKLQRDILLAQDLDRYIAASVRSTWPAACHAKDSNQAMKAASEHKARQERLSPRCRLSKARLVADRKVFEKQTRADSWALMRPGSKKLRRQASNMPKTANEFQYQALLPKVPELRKKRLKNTKELQLISEVDLQIQ